VATFYRIVRSDPPSEADFYSHHALGRRLRRDTPALRRSWEGVSVTSTEAAIRDLARRFPRLGRFVAVLSIADDGPVRYEQSGESSAHYDLFGEPREMLAAVQAVWPLEEGATDVCNLESGDGQP
jgi:hypothetical protein